MRTLFFKQVDGCQMFLNLKVLRFCKDLKLEGFKEFGLRGLGPAKGRGGRNLCLIW